jgi:hypothetical protein
LTSATDWDSLFSVRANPNQENRTMANTTTPRYCAE